MLGLCSLRLLVHENDIGLASLSGDAASLCVLNRGCEGDLGTTLALGLLDSPPTLFQSVDPYDTYDKNENSTFFTIVDQVRRALSNTLALPQVPLSPLCGARWRSALSWFALCSSRHLWPASHL